MAPVTRVGVGSALVPWAGSIGIVTTAMEAYGLACQPLYHQSGPSMSAHVASGKKVRVERTGWPRQAAKLWVQAARRPSQYTPERSWYGGLGGALAHEDEGGREAGEDGECRG